MSTPSSWTPEERQIAKEIARLGAIEAVEELHVKLASSLLNKLLNMIFMIVLIWFLKVILLSNSTILQGIKDASSN